MVKRGWKTRLRKAAIVAVAALATGALFYALTLIVSIHDASAETFAYVKWTRSAGDTDTPFDRRDTDVKFSDDVLYPFVQSQEAIVRLTGDDTGVTRVLGDVRLADFSDSVTCRDYLFDTLNTKFWPRHWK